jgi:MFS family permease
MRVWYAVIAIAQLGLWLGLYAPLKTLLPLLADQLSLSSGIGKEGLLAAATLAGSLVALLANPMAGALSDRTQGFWGPRRPWIFGGGLLAALSLWLLPQASTGLTLLVLWCCTKLGLNACMAAINGMVADAVPAVQQGRLWGWVGLAQPVGLVLGDSLSTWLLPNLARAALLQALLVLLCCLPALSLSRGQVQAFRPRPGGLLSAFRSRVFRSLWWSRFWLYLGWSMSTVYLLYFLEDRLGLPRSEALQAQALLLGLYAAGTVASAAVAGWASDRSGRRLVFVVMGSLGMATACSLMLVSHTLTVALVGAGLLGVAYGIYIATHQALVLEHLPDHRHHARDLGVFNGANTMPMVLAPALAWLCVVYLGGYASLFALAGILMAMSLLCLTGVEFKIHRFPNQWKVPAE